MYACVGGLKSVAGALLKKVLLIVAASLRMSDEPVFLDLEVPSYGMLCRGRSDATSTNQEVKREEKGRKVYCRSVD